MSTRKIAGLKQKRAALPARLQRKQRATRYASRSEMIAPRAAWVRVHLPAPAFGAARYPIEERSLLVSAAPCIACRTACRHRPVRHIDGTGAACKKNSRSPRSSHRVVVIAPHAHINQRKLCSLPLRLHAHYVLIVLCPGFQLCGVAL